MQEIKYGILLGGSVIIIWWFWAIFYYKWSTARLTQLIIKQYKRSLPSTETSIITLDKITISNDKTFLLVDIIQHDDHNQIISKKTMRYDIKEPCDILDEKCITI